MATKTKSAAPVLPAQQLSAVIKAARDIMRKDKGLNGDLDRLPMLTWIMFLKFLDDKEQVWEAEAKVAGKTYRRLIEPPYRWRDWAGKDEGITGEDLIVFISNEEATRPDGKKGAGLFPYLRKLQSSNGGDRRDVIAAVFKGTINRMVNGYLLRDVINKVNQLHFTQSAETHVLSHLYESLLKEMRDSAGDSGEFYTPRPVVRFIVEAIGPQVGETVLDPAAGTGGFLVEAFEHMMKRYKSTKDRETIQKSLHGIEAKPLPYLLCQMNLLLHGVEYPQIDPGNALRFPLQDIGDKERVDVIVTNPPFGGEEARGILANFPDDKQTAETALLFLQLIMRKLRRVGTGPHKAGGRCGMVVPDGVLFGGGVATKTKSELLRDFNLHTIVRLPNGVFAPYTGIPTNLLFFDRTGPTREIWYYEIPVSDGRKNYTKTQPIQFEEFLPCLAWWKDRRESERAWKVPVADVLKSGENGEALSVNLDAKNPNTSRDLRHVAPAELVEISLREQSRLAKILSEAKALVGALDLPVLDYQKYATRLADSPIELNRETRNPASFYGDKEFVYIDISSVESGPSVIRSGKRLKGIDAPSRARKVVHKGDIIVSTVRINLRTVALVGDELDDAVCSTGFAVFSCPASVDPEFMLYQLCSPFFIDQCIAKSTGGHYPAINDQRLREVMIVIPPIEVQRQIVHRLRQVYPKIHQSVSAATETWQESAKALEQLPTAILNRAFSVPTAA